jgi:hypothetical protein
MVHRPRASTATMNITRTRARLMGTMGQVGSPAASLSEPAHGSAAITDALAFTAVPATSAGLVSGLAQLLADLPTSDAGRLAVGSAVATRAVATHEVALAAADAGRLRP